MTQFWHLLILFSLNYIVHSKAWCLNWVLSLYTVEDTEQLILCYRLTLLPMLKIHRGIISLLVRVRWRRNLYMQFAGYIIPWNTLLSNSARHWLLSALNCFIGIFLISKTCWLAVSLVTTNKKVLAMKKSRQPPNGNNAIPSLLNSSTYNSWAYCEYIDCKQHCKKINKKKNTCPYPLLQLSALITTVERTMHNALMLL